MKKNRFDQSKPKSIILSNNLKFYGTIVSVALGMMGLFAFAYWGMSIAFPAKEISSLTPTISPQPTNNISPSIPPIAQPTVPLVIPTTSDIPVAANTNNSLLSVNPAPINGGAFTYNVASKATFQSSKKLQLVVDNVVNYIKINNLPPNALSVTLINTNTSERADYQGSIERYPASVVKLFWLVAIYQRINLGEATEASLKTSIEQMIYKSDNQGASQVLDKITGTKSTLDKLSESDLKVKKQLRQSINDSFRQAGYSSDINVSQKTFPIPQENIMEPKGFDQQLRGDNPQKPNRNRITTNDASQLMYEIIKAQAINPETSQKMQSLLMRNINPDFWKKQPPNPIDFNPVESFLGEGLPVGKTNDIVSKAGWTSLSRQEVAYISSKDGRTKYILAVFGDDVAYGKSKKIFPEISKMVYQQMRQETK